MISARTEILTNHSFGKRLPMDQVKELCDRLTEEIDGYLKQEFNEYTVIWMAGEYQLLSDITRWDVNNEQEKKAFIELIDYIFKAEQKASRKVVEYIRYGIDKSVANS